MSVPAQPATFLVTTDYVSLLTLRHPAVPGALGYKYFQGASSGAALALANADIAVDVAARAGNPPPVTPPVSVPVGFGGIASNTNVLTDAESDLIGFGTPTYGGVANLVSCSRAASLGEVTFVQDVGAPSTPTAYYFVVVAWNEDGPSTPLVASIVYKAASSPVITSVVAKETTIDVTFDQAVLSPTGQLGVGFTFRLSGNLLLPSSVIAVSGHPEILRFTFAPIIDDGATVTFAYSSVSGDLTNSIQANPVATVAQTAVTSNISKHAHLFDIVVPPGPPPTVIHLVFSQPVISLGNDYLVGLGVTINGTPVTPLSVAPGDDVRELVITLTPSISVTDQVVVNYNATLGDWQSTGYPLRSIYGIAINGSRIGLPVSAYPLSSAILEPLAAQQGTITATIGLDLNYVDRQLADRYGAAQIDIGGTFGVTLANPLGVLVPQNFQALVAGLTIKQTFFVTGHPEWAQVAATEWLDATAAKIGAALAALRTTDQGVVLGTLSIEQV